jgi:hypothetical protein
MRYLYLYLSLLWVWIVFGEVLYSTTDIDIADLLASSITLSRTDSSQLEPLNELSSSLLSHHQEISPQYNSYGWFSLTYSSSSSCDFIDNLIQTYGVVTNQCLYSKKFSFYYRITCYFENQRARILFYKNSECTLIMQNDFVQLDSCFIDQRSGASFKYQCSNNYQVLPLPIDSHKNIIVYR